MTSRDTAPAARDTQRAVHRAIGGAGRVELAFAMSEQAREIAICGTMARDTALSYDDARARVLRRLLGGRLYDLAYPESGPC